MNEQTERNLEQLQQDFDESKVVRDFSYTPAGQTMLEVLQRTIENFTLLREAQRDLIYRNPLQEMCLDAELRGRIKGLRWVISWLKASPEEVQRLHKEMEKLEKQDQSIKQFALINKGDSKIR